MKVFLGFAVLIILGISIFGVIMLFNWNELGKSPRGDDLLRIEKSKHFNQEKGKFSNLEIHPSTKDKKKGLDWQLMKDWFSPGIDRVPLTSLPEHKPDLVEFLQGANKLQTIWLGHSSFLLNIEGNIVLVDPVFSSAASPIKSMVKRFQEPVLALEELPAIDYVLISHDHYDHLDMQSIMFFADKDVKFITPLGVGSHLKKWGVAPSKITEKDWWQTADFDGVKFIATPAHHFSGRNGLDANATLWASWVIQSKSHKVYFSGDSGYGTHFKEIGKKYGPFDVAFIESGQYNEKWQDVHMLPSEGVKAFKDLGAEKYFPIHWGMFELALHTWYDPIEQLYALSKSEAFELLTPRIGQLVDIEQSETNELWWQKSTLTSQSKWQMIETVAVN